MDYSLHKILQTQRTLHVQNQISLFLISDEINTKFMEHTAIEHCSWLSLTILGAVSFFVVFFTLVTVRNNMLKQ